MGPAPKIPNRSPVRARMGIQEIPSAAVPRWRQEREHNPQSAPSMVTIIVQVPVKRALTKKVSTLLIRTFNLRGCWGDTHAFEKKYRGFEGSDCHRYW